MLGTYFYHEIIRKTVISFGTLFNQIYIVHKDSSDINVSQIRVPIAYGPMQKFLARIQQQPELNKPIQISLPRMSFEMTSIEYDPTRKASLKRASSKMGALPVLKRLNLIRNITRPDLEVKKVLSKDVEYMKGIYEKEKARQSRAKAGSKKAKKSKTSL